MSYAFPDESVSSPPISRPLLTQAQREAIRAVMTQRRHIEATIRAARRAHAIFIAQQEVKLESLPSAGELAKQYGVSKPCIFTAARGHRYINAHILDERAEARMGAVS